LILNAFVHGPPLHITVADVRDPFAVAPCARSTIVAGVAV